MTHKSRSLLFTPRGHRITHT